MVVASNHHPVKVVIVEIRQKMIAPSIHKARQPTMHQADDSKF